MSNITLSGIIVIIGPKMLFTDVTRNRLQKIRVLSPTWVSGFYTKDTFLLKAENDSVEISETFLAENNKQQTTQNVGGGIAQR